MPIEAYKTGWSAWKWVQAINSKPLPLCKEASCSCDGKYDSWCWLLWPCHDGLGASSTGVSQQSCPRPASDHISTISPPLQGTFIHRVIQLRHILPHSHRQQNIFFRGSWHLVILTVWSSSPLLCLATNVDSFFFFVSCYILIQPPGPRYQKPFVRSFSTICVWLYL